MRDHRLHRPGMAGKRLVRQDEGGGSLRRRAGVTRGSVPALNAGCTWDFQVEWEAFPQNTVSGLGTR